MEQSRIRVAVLGGGAGALSAAFALTSPNNPSAARYDVTVYQLGWRLGGKGASGRNAAHADRIEEHGLHVWMGFYENAFAVMREAYAEWTSPDNVFGSWRNAFTPQSFVPYEEMIGGQWRIWPVRYPQNDALPGDGTELPTPWQVAELLLDELCVLVTHHHLVTPPQRPADHASWLSHLAHAAGDAIDGLLADAGEHLLHHALDFVRHLGPDTSTHPAGAHDALITLLDRFGRWLWARLGSLAGLSDDLRRTWMLVDLGTAALRGALAARVFERGFGVLDDEDFRTFLRRNGASNDTLASVPVRALYDLFFAFEQGDIARPNLAAGVALRALCRMLFTYKGAIFWKMNAGMGDTIFTPLYEVLKSRGVRFNFFHRVTAVESGGGRIARVRMMRQVRLREGAETYDPCVRIHGLPCWPSEPRYEQLDPAQAALLQEHGIDLESFWTPWQQMGEETPVDLEAGRDFDLVVLGIPPAALQHILSPEIRQQPHWARMLETVTTVQTQAMQLWLSRDLEGLGWKMESPITTAYAEPMDTWCDMTHLLPMERWPEGEAPKNISYFCGPMQDAAHIPPPDEHGFPEEESERVRATSVQWLNAEIARFWPAAAPPGNPAGLDWSLLVAPGDTRRDEARFATQFWRANCDPAQRYTLSTAGSIGNRLKADGSGYGNLFLAGDWIDCILNVGCVEATVMSGLLCSRAISGYPARIVGEGM